MLLRTTGPRREAKGLSTCRGYRTVMIVLIDSCFQSNAGPSNGYADYLLCRSISLAVPFWELKRPRRGKQTQQRPFDRPQLVWPGACDALSYPL